MALDKTSEAVEALHQTMVMLREELAKKNAKIKVLEKQLNKSLETITVELYPEKEINTISTRNSDFKINEEVFEETRNYVEKNIVVENCDDLVHEFHISDDDEEQEKKSPSELKSENNMQYSRVLMSSFEDFPPREAALKHCAFEETDVKTHTLFIHKDIDVHYPPEVSNNFQKNKNNKQSAEVTFCNVRPILKMPSISPRSCRGSQTDISALCSGLVDQSTEYLRTASAEPTEIIPIHESRAWGSEPSLIHDSTKQGGETYSSRANSAASVVTFADDLETVTTYNIKSSRIQQSRGVKKIIQQRKNNEKIMDSGGRYTIVNKNLVFEPIEIPQHEIKKAVIDWEAFDKLKEFDFRQISYSKSFSSNNSGSTDSLLEEANNFLDIAKDRFVTSEDWIEIKSKKNYNYPSISDLKIRDQIQYIGQDLELQDGQIVNIIPEDQLVHVAVTEDTFEVIPFDKIVKLKKLNKEL